MDNTTSLPNFMFNYLNSNQMRLPNFAIQSLRLFTAAIIFTGFSLSAFGQCGTTTWTGAGAANDWTDAANWSAGVPLDCSIAIIGATANDPNLSTVDTVHTLVVETGAKLLISGGTMNVSDSLVVNGTLENEGRFDFLGLDKPFEMGAAGEYIHNPSLSISDTISAHIFSKAREKFNHSSHVIFKTWYDPDASPFTFIDSIGHMTVTPITTSPIHSNQAANGWFWNERTEDKIKGDLNIFDAQLRMGFNPITATVQIGLSTGATPTAPIKVEIGGSLRLFEPTSDFSVWYLTTTIPNQTLERGALVSADTVIINNGTFRLVDAGANAAGMQAAYTFSTRSGLFMTNGRFDIVFNHNNNVINSSLSFDSDVHLNGASTLFYLARGMDIDVTMTGKEFTATDISNLQFSMRYTNVGSSGILSLDYEKLVSTNSNIQMVNGSSSVATLNIDTLIIGGVGDSSSFDGCHGDPIGQSTGNLTINSDYFEVNTTKGVSLQGGYSSGTFDCNISGDLILKNGEFYLSENVLGGTLDVGGNLMVENVDFKYLYTIPQAANANPTMVNVDGNFIQSGGSFDFDELQSNTGAMSLIVGGDFIHSAGTFRDFPDRTSTVTFNGLTDQLIDGGASTDFFNLSINNLGQIEVDSTDLLVENQFTLSSGRVFLDSSNITLDFTALPIAGNFGPDAMIVQDDHSLFRRFVIAAGFYTYPIGDTLNGTVDYAPMTFNITNGTFGANPLLGVQTYNEIHPNNANLTNYLERYWEPKVNDITDLTADFTASYSQTDVIGTETDIASGTWTGALPWVKGALTDDATNTLSFPGQTDFLEYSGIDNVLPQVTITAPDTLRCETGDSILLTAVVIGDSSFTYSWDPATGLGSTTDSAVMAAPATTTDYTVTVTDGNGFENTSEVFTLHVIPAPATPTVTSPINYCIDETADPLSASGTNLIWWEGSPGNNPTTTAPTPSTAMVGTTSYFVRDSVGSCLSDTAQIDVIINPDEDASFDYNGLSQFCNSGTSPAANVTGVAGGTFTASSGMTIDGTTGEIDLDNTPVGSYMVYYTTSGTCPGSDSISIDVISTPDAGIDYNDPFCQSDVNPLPTYDQGNPTGTFTSEGGIVFADNTSGEIDLANSAAGTEYVYFEIPAGGGCPSVNDSTLVEIKATPASPTFTSPVEYCKDETASPLSATGTNILWYSDATGGTGDPNAPTPSTSTLGTTYFYLSQTVDGCESERDSIEVIINPADDPSFSYPNGVYTQSDPDPSPTITGLTGGTFSGDNGMIIDPSTGVIDLSANNVGIYEVKYVTNGQCPDSTTFTIEIQPACQASFTYPTPVCITGNNPIASLDAGSEAGGTYGSQTLNFVDQNTGEIDLSTASAGTHRIYYGLTAGSCAGFVDSFDITINQTALPFVNSPVQYCVGDQASSLQATGSNILWYAAQTGGIGTSSAPTPSTSQVGSTDYFVSQTVNGCESDRNTITVIVDQDDASFSYSQNAYCAGANNPTPIINGNQGGTFTATSGMTINASTGEIDMSNTAPGSYMVTYTTNGTCPNSETTQIDIVTQASATFSYTSPLCLNDPNPFPTIAQGSTSGSFGSLTLSFVNNSTGEINMSAANPGTHRIYNYVQAQGNCGFAVDSFDLIINPSPAAPGVSSPVNYCTGEQASSLTANGTNLLWYSDPQGLGDVNAPTPSTASPGTTDYYVTQTNADGCESPQATITVNVDPQDDASFNYDQGTFCKSNPNNPTPVITGTLGGTFSSSAGLALSTSTGEIDLANSNPGNYQVKYLTNGVCADSSEFTVSIVQSFDASFTYNSPLCNQGPNPLPIIGQGASSGIFTSSTVNFVDQNTGEIDLSSANLGTHRIYNNVQGVGNCPAAIDSFDIQIDPSPQAPGVNSPINYCINDNASQLSANGSNLLWYTSSNGGGGGNPAAPTPSTANPGTTWFFVTQTVGGCESAFDSIEVVVNDLDDTQVQYTSGSFCATQDSAVPTFVASPGGVFSSPNGLLVNASTGVIDINGTGFGTYDLDYQTNGACPNFGTQTIVIDSFVDGSFFYDGNFCQNALNPLPTFVGSGQAGTFTASASGVVFVDPSTGEIDINASTPGDYVITNTTQAIGACPTANHTNNIELLPAAVITIDDTTIECGAFGKLASVVNVPGGDYLWTPTNEVTKTIYVNPTQTSTYIVTYDAGNGCEDSDTAVVTVNPIDVSLEPFGEACKGWSGFALSGGLPDGGVYSGAAVSDNIFYPSQAQVGANTVTYTVTNGNCSNSASETIIVDECLGINEPDMELEFILAPNPNSGEFEVKINKPNYTGGYKVIDLHGKVVYSASVSNTNSIKINLPDLPNGIYFLNIYSQEVQKMLRFELRK